MTVEDSKIKVRVRRLPNYGELALPAYQTEGSAGMDLLAAVQAEGLVLKAGSYALIPAGIALELPDGFEAQIRPRSGLAVKYGIGILNSPGTIDADYRGEIKIALINLGAADFVIERGMRIAQMVIAPITKAELIDAVSLSDTGRSDGGFGHTGL